MPKNVSEVQLTLELASVLNPTNTNVTQLDSETPDDDDLFLLVSQLRLTRQKGIRKPKQIDIDEADTSDEIFLS
mgnify:CR=1 FL=1